MAKPRARNDGIGLDDGRDVHDREAAPDQAAEDTEQPADPGEDHGLDEELREDVTVARADGFADADLACAFGNGHEHDVHDADAADEQRDRGDRGRAAR